MDRDEALDKLSSMLSGTAESRIQFLFELHDTRGRGYLKRDDVKRMLDASLRQNEIRITPREKTSLVEALFDTADGKSGRADGCLDFLRSTAF